MSDTIRAQVSTVAEHAGVTMTATWLGLKPKALGGNHPMDRWSITFAKDKATENFDFFTGLGLRKAPPWGPAVRGYDNGPAPRRGSLLHEQWMQQAKPQPPHMADVLCSLIRDSSAATQSFES